MLVLLPFVFPCVISTLLYEDSHYSAKNPVNQETKRHKRSSLFGCPEEGACEPYACYREYDGRCNNLYYPLWGSIEVPYLRFIPSQVREGKGPPNTNQCGSLPKAREIVAAMIKSEFKKYASTVTVMNMQFGQLISHDINNTPTTTGVRCCVDCSDEGVTESEECLPIDVTNDTFYSQFNVNCLQLSRSKPADFSCTGDSREQVNEVTAYIDGSVIYGLSETAARNLRTLSNGQMKTFDEPEDLSGQCPAETSCPFSLLPKVVNNGRENILAGDSRAAQQPALTSMQHLFVRIHNDFAARLAAKHSWDDEKLFQEARKAVIAILQHITYNEYLPSILSDASLDEYQFRPLASGYFEEYDYTVDATLYNAFSAAAFRFGHSLIPDIFKMADGNNFNLSESFINFRKSYNSSMYPSNILNGISVQKSQHLDQVLVTSLTNKLFATGPNFLFGSDLFSRNILRGRDHELPPYLKFREYCGLSEIINHSQLRPIMKNEVAGILKELYHCVKNVDLYVALISENPKGNGIVGPTLSCLLGEQFKNLKYGDRFYYETNQEPGKFTEDQLASIRRTTFAAILCRYTNTQSAPLKAMEVQATENTVESCDSILPNTMMSQFDDYW